jgi:hypothetical protein
LGTVRLKSSFSKSSGDFCGKTEYPELFGCKRHAYVSSSQQPTSKGRVCDNGDTQLSRGFKQSNLGIFYIEHERRVLNLKSGDGVDCVGASKSLGGALRQAEIFNLPFSENNLLRLLREEEEGPHLTSSAMAPTVTYCSA